ncbi:MAG: FG-GAP-like repeat-containing protein, partial [Phycisphaerae bacterium]|nr:FG-GAP-like repeat-containing protein [Phycisphaerae bacterium]
SLVRLAEAKHVLSVFDSCFSGTIFQARSSAAPKAITRKTTAAVRQFITSGDAGQEVRDDGSFREYFIRALRGEERSDFNGDGYVDLHVTNFNFHANRLYKNNGDGTFTDIAASAGVADAAFSNGSSWVDYDGDGDVDMLMPQFFDPDAVKLYRNNGDETFANVAESGGLTGLRW